MFIAVGMVVARMGGFAASQLHMVDYPPSRLRIFKGVPKDCTEH